MKQNIHQFTNYYYFTKNNNSKNYKKNLLFFKILLFFFAAHLQVFSQCTFITSEFSCTGKCDLNDDGQYIAQGTRWVKQFSFRNLEPCDAKNFKLRVFDCKLDGNSFPDLVNKDSEQSFSIDSYKNGIANFIYTFPTDAKPGTYHMHFDIVDEKGIALPLGPYRRVGATVTVNAPPSNLSPSASYSQYTSEFWISPYGFPCNVMKDTLIYKYPKNIHFKHTIQNNDDPESKYKKDLNYAFRLFMIQNGGLALHPNVTHGSASVGPGGSYTFNYDRNTEDELGSNTLNLPGKYIMYFNYITGTTSIYNVNYPGNKYATYPLTIIKATSDLCQCGLIWEDDHIRPADCFKRGFPIKYGWTFTNYQNCSTEKQYFLLESINRLNDDGDIIETISPTDGRYVYYTDETGMVFSDRHELPLIKNKGMFQTELYFSFAPKESGNYKLIYRRYQANSTFDKKDDKVFPKQSAESPTEEAYITICKEDYINEHLQFYKCAEAPESIIEKNKGSFTVYLENIGTVGFLTTVSVNLRNKNGLTHNLFNKQMRFEAKEKKDALTFEVPVNATPGDYELDVTYLSDKEKPGGEVKSYIAGKGTCAPKMVTVLPMITHEGVFKLRSPGTPLNKPAPIEDEMKFKLKWHQMEGAKGYNVVVEDKKNKEKIYEYKTSIATQIETPTIVPVDKLKYDTEYLYYGAAIDSKGNTVYCEDTLHFITPPDITDCKITDIDKTKFPERFTAACVFMKKGILDGSDNLVQPDATIIRQDLAKVGVIGLWGDFNTMPGTFITDNYNVPYLDLSKAWQDYFRYAIFASYYAHKDDKERVVPFKGVNGNFEPEEFIQQKNTLKVLLELFNIQPENGRTPDDYVQKAAEMGITDPIDGDDDVNGKNAFDPDALTLRYQAFVWLYRIMKHTEVVKPTTDDLNNLDNFLEPGFYGANSFNITPKVTDGNFQHAEATGLTLPGVGMSVGFSFNYNSYSSEMPDEFYPFWPLGEGMSHTYHAYIKKIKGYSVGNSTCPEHILIFWPMSVAPDAFEYANNTIGKAVTKGLTYTISQSGNNIVIKDLDDNVFTFSKLSGDDQTLWRLMSIKDKNNNTVTLFYDNHTPIKRLERVEGTKMLYKDYPSHALYFSYGDTDPMKITWVKENLDVDEYYDVSFDYFDNKMIYYDVLNSKTEYWYKPGANESKLLYSIRLPKGNYIDNEYWDRKLKSSQSFDQNGVPTNNGFTRTSKYNSSTGYITTTVTDVQGITTTTTRNKDGYIVDMERTRADKNKENLKFEYKDLKCSWKPSKITYYNVVTNITYNEKGQKETATVTDGTTTITEKWTYNDYRVATYTDPEENKFSTFYDNVGNIDYTTDANGNKIADYYINSRGVLENVSLLGKTTSDNDRLLYKFEYNEYGQPVKAILPDGSFAETGYDKYGFKKWDRNPLGDTVKYFVKKNGLIDYVEDATGNRVESKYDANYNNTKIINSKGGETLMDYYYDTDLLKSVTTAGKSSYMEYRKNGQIDKLTDRKGQIFDFDYWDNGLLKKDGYYWYNYDDRDRTKEIFQIANANNKIEYTAYDAFDRLKEYMAYYADGTSYKVGYNRDKRGNISEKIYPDGAGKVTYTFDANNRPDKVIVDILGKNLVFNADLYADGVVQKITYPNSVTKTFLRDDNLGRVSRVKTERLGSVISDYFFFYDKRGFIDSSVFHEPFEPSTKQISGVKFTVDANNRITGDSNGKTYLYDDNGNTVQYGLYKNTQWTQLNQIKHIETVDGSFVADYEYDVLGNRTKATRNGVTTTYAYDIAGMGYILREECNGKTWYYIYGYGQLLARISNTGEVQYYHTDVRGSVIAMTNETGTIVNKYAYSPYGQITAMQETGGENRFRWIGGYGVIYENDSLYHMRARYYDVYTMRFLSEDPIWNTNLFNYAGNNPVMGMDPDGKFWDYVLDVVTILYDIGEVIKDPSLGNFAMLGVDIVAGVIPFIPSPGVVRVAAKIGLKLTKYDVTFMKAATNLGIDGANFMYSIYSSDIVGTSVGLFSPTMNFIDELCDKSKDKYCKIVKNTTTVLKTIETAPKAFELGKEIIDLISDDTNQGKCDPKNACCKGGYQYGDYWYDINNPNGKYNGPILNGAGSMAPYPK